MTGEAELCACGCERPAWRWRLAEPCVYALAASCLGKTPFTRQYRAQLYRAPGQGTYQCPVCGNWHNGRQSDHTEANAERRDEVIAGLRRNGNGWMLAVVGDGLRQMDRIKWKTRKVIEP